VSERLIPPTAYSHANDRFTNSGYVMRGTDVVCMIGSKYETYLPLRDMDPKSEQSDMYFGSPHIKGINVGFGDGSVRPIAYTVSPETWIALGGRNDGGIPGPDGD
jgi:prepilin-type processing-associated H-X9-DG protein